MITKVFRKTCNFFSICASNKVWPVLVTNSAKRHFNENTYEGMPAVRGN